MTDATQPTPPPFTRKKTFLEDRSRRDTDRQQRWWLTAILATLAVTLCGLAFITL